MTNLAVRRIQGSSVLIAIGAIVTALLYFAYAPIRDAEASLVEAQEQVARFQASVSKDRSGAAVDVSGLIRPSGPAASTLRVQRSLVDLVQLAGLAQQELRALPEQKLDRGIVQLSYGLVLTGDLDQWTRFMQELSRQKPAILVDKVVLAGGSAHRADIAMRIEMQVSAYTMEAAARDE